MTTLVSRTPLEPLSMSTVQRGKRKVATRLHLEEEDALPAKKKNKVEAESHGTNGTTRGRQKRLKQDYEEENDGFVFRRKRNTRAQPKEDSAHYEVPAHGDSTRKKDTRKRKLSPPPNETQSRPRRRSARLSNEKTDDANENLAPEVPKRGRKIAPPPTHPQLGAERDTSPEHAPPAISSGKQRSRDEGIKIALPFADTPVIKRNKDMRANNRKSSSGSRRSSAALRGRRASSLIESGNSHAVPHADVEIPEFYKLIEDGLPERRRMRQLLTWCATRALLEKPQPSKGTSTLETIAIESARQIQDELLKDFSTKDELSDWWSREESLPASATKKPNPRNIANRQKLEELEAEILRLEGEEKTWKALSKPSKPAPSPAAISPLSITINTSLLSQSQQRLLDSLALTTTRPIDAINQRLQAATSKLEPSVDSFADGIHQLTLYNTTAARVADKIKVIWSKRLDKRDQDAREQAGTSDVGTGDLLRALAGKLNEKR